jgi:hypothetical protein
MVEIRGALRHSLQAGVARGRDLDSDIFAHPFKVMPS